LKAVQAIRNAGCEVVGMAAIFTYQFPIATEKFEEANVKLVTIGNYSSMLEAAVKINYIKESDIAALEEWRKDPANWTPNTDRNAD
jgi:orotate phosphoribosyltransferase